MRGPEPQKPGDEVSGPRTGVRRQWDVADADGRLDHRRTRNAAYKRVRIHVALTEQELAVLDARPSRMSGGRERSRSELLGRIPACDGDVRWAQQTWSARGSKEDQADRGAGPGPARIPVALPPD